MELKPLLSLTKALTWEQVGSSLMSRSELANTLKIFGREALKQRSFLNGMYKQVHTMKEVSVQKTWDLFDILIKYGANYMTVDYYFAFMCAAY
mmetsp:Transcript_29918/g.29093  ORF Transcript_29918/g.29093 Transcript_29918/m.29093 type:complete len:93 (+) Transcript_29918:185-463(+)